ncbi:MAG: pantetheine-phosphate adenylyltransferase [Betaproteobacteria bacterium AqS2]|uniref:Phosphopantetheine adenylyltransferase n=1 Tax=Candidatus Amphirhobacter heronislandensis TaxID=1732024 RepID=A0A930UHQ7_9GAMM|nr:pantetheine-phosphate adenylyltransferase [Betaproteobacteria bacterium AqS2]
MGKPGVIAYPGTFDPPTRGHESVIRRAAKIFGEVRVLVAAGVHKDPLFTLDERQKMIATAVADQANVTVAPLEGLLADHLKAAGIGVVLRGLRNVADYEREIQLADIQRRLGQVETMFIAPNNEFIHVASSLVREIAMLGGDLSNYVNPEVAARLRKKFGHG